MTDKTKQKSEERQMSLSIGEQDKKGAIGRGKENGAVSGQEQNIFQTERNIKKSKKRQV